MKSRVKAKLLPQSIGDTSPYGSYDSRHAIFPIRFFFAVVGAAIVGEAGCAWLGGLVIEPEAADEFPFVAADAAQSWPPLPSHAAGFIFFFGHGRMI